MRDEKAKVGQELIEKLLVACAAGNVDEIRQCVEQGADINVKLMDLGVGRMRWPLMEAVKSGNHLAVMHLLAWGAKPDMGPDSELAVSERKNIKSNIELLLNEGASPNRGTMEATLDSAFVISMKNGFPRMRQYLNYGANVNHALPLYLWSNGQTEPEVINFKSLALPLAITTHYNYLDFAVELIEHGADLRAHLKDGNCVLAHICASGIERFARRMVKDHPDFDSFTSVTGDSFLKSVMSLTTIESRINVLVAAGANCEGTVFEKYEAPDLFYAVKTNNQEFVVQALERGANMHSKADEGMSILEYAKEKDRDMALPILRIWEAKSAAIDALEECLAKPVP